MVGRVPETESFGRQNADKERAERGLRDALRIDGSQFVKLYEKMQALVNNLGATVTALVSAITYTRAEVDSKVASPGNITPGTVTASGAISGSTGTFPNGVNSTTVYSRLLTYGGAYTSTYTHVDGSMGTVPSSRRYKQDIEPLVLDPATVSSLRLVTFRYIAAVENLGEDASSEVGLIAEEVHALGLTWLVDYDDDGQPNGVKYERVALALLAWTQSIEQRLDAAGL